MPNTTATPVQAIEGEFVLTCDFNRKYESTKHVDSWIIETTVRFVETYSKFIFNPKVSGM